EKTLADKKKKLAEKQVTDPSNTAQEQQDVKDAKTALDKGVTDTLAAVSDGLWLSAADFLPPNGESLKIGLYALEQADLFNLLNIPGYHNLTDQQDFDVPVISAAAAYCEKRRAMLLVDAPKDWKDKDTALSKFNDATNDYVGTRSRNAALFFPRI